MNRVKLNDLILSDGTQCRVSLDQDHIASISEAITAGVSIPAVIVFHNGTSYWLADGFHRYHAYEKCGQVEIDADVRSGTRLDAIKFALGANAAHGLRRTNADKRRVVEIALKEFPKLSSAEIARVCAVGDDLVGDMRRQRQPSFSEGSETRLGADGKTRKMPVRTVTVREIPMEVPIDGHGRREAAARSLLAGVPEVPAVPPCEKSEKPEARQRNEYTEARRIWSGVKPRLDAIRDNDPELAKVMREISKYALNRIA